MAGTALGFIAVPHLISILLEEYGFHSTMLLVGALSLNAAVGASLLQPVKWHMKPLESQVRLNECLLIFVYYFLFLILLQLFVVSSHCNTLVQLKSNIKINCDVSSHPCAVFLDREGKHHINQVEHE